MITVHAEKAFPAYVATIVKSRSNSQLNFVGSTARILSVTCRPTGDRYYMCKGIANDDNARVRVYWINVHYNPVNGKYAIPKPQVG